MKARACDGEPALRSCVASLIDRALLLQVLLFLKIRLRCYLAKTCFRGAFLLRDSSDRLPLAQRVGSRALILGGLGIWAESLRCLDAQNSSDARRVNVGLLCCLFRVFLQLLVQTA